MRLVILALLVPTVGSVVASADPAPSFDVIDRGTAVEVIAHNVTALKTAITPIRSRLEIPIAGHPRADKALPTDATVKVVEFDGTEPRVMSVKLGFERPEVKALAKYAQAIQVGPDVHMMFPRVVPAEGAAIVLPEPTLPAELAAKLAATKPAAPVIAPVVTAPPIAAVPVIAPVAAKTEIKAEPKTEPKTEVKPEAKPAAATTTPSSTTKPATAGAPSEDAWQKLSLYGAAGLAAIGCGVWLLRRRKAALGVTSSIDVIAQKSLGAKAKIVWFTAGGREMVVAVTPQSVRMLGQWKKCADGTNSPRMALPEAHTLSEGTREIRTERPATNSNTSNSSAAVAGILKLRERPSMNNIPIVNEEVATEDVDADALWAQEILAATGARR